VWLVVTTSVMIAAELWARSRPIVVSSPEAARLIRPSVVAAFEEEPPVPSQAQVQLAPAAARPMTRAEIRRQRAAAAPPESATEELERLPLSKAVGIGLAQAVALIPGTSRSGVTISAGLFEDVSREAAARFSFLLSIPAIFGAGLLKLDELSRASESPAQLAVGFLAAALSGFLAVSFLIRLLRTRTLWPFIWYRLIAGGLFVVLLATVRG
jgi:undecaprenyl-diphosphatase